MHPAFLVLVLAPLCLAHMQMTKPYPFKSPYDPANDYTVIDYSMNSPLEQDGSNYPCKGYNSLLASTPIKDTLTAGASFSITVGGTAAHNGGSCQVSLSYDGGENFAVIHSMIGGCPLTNEYEFTVPKDAPAGDKVILAWSWINNTGNREFYQNCSPVRVVNTNAQAVLRAPALYRANSFADGTCITPEGLDIVFPNPGDSVVYGGAYASNRPTTVTKLANCPFDESRTLVISSTGSVGSETPEEGGSSSIAAPSISVSVTSTKPQMAESSAPLPTSTSRNAITTEEDSYTTKSAGEVFSIPGKVHMTTSSLDTLISSGFVTSTSYAVRPTTTSSIEESEKPTSVKNPVISYTAKLPSSALVVTIVAPSPIATSDKHTVCENNALKCTGKGYTFSSCWDNRWIAMGSVAAGTICRHGEIAMDFPEAKCTDSAIQCTSNTTWSLCSANEYIPMGSVALGTQCIDGKIVAAPASGHLRMRRMSAHSNRNRRLR